MKLDEIAKILNLSNTTISREIKRNRTVNISWRKPNKCIYLLECRIKHLCKDKQCSSECRRCEFNRNCTDFCPKYQKVQCNRIIRFPYVCDGCKEKRKCVLDHYHYDPVEAENKANKALHEARRGIDLSVEEFATIDSLVNKKTSLGQSIEHISSYSEFPVSSRTIRRYIKYGLLTTKIIDLPRAVTFKPRAKKVSKEDLKNSKRAKQGRDLAAFLNYMDANNYFMYSEIDTVEGIKNSENEPRLLTIINPKYRLFLSFLLKNGSSLEIKRKFNELYKILGFEDFNFMFNILLTDNGPEFSRPEDIEIDLENNRIRSHVFYCHPYSSWEKGAIEVCHELFRRIVPKGTTLKHLTEEKVCLINSHINSYYRAINDGSSAYKVFVNAYGEKALRILKILKIKEINPEDINLTPQLIK